ncbi:GntR family transcriptional regulator [Mesorhizobium sp. CA8]|nr:GntR family transcriptional regulator [Mesorhizobium sp. CA8]MBZ9821388.1 GntR family transcriptional regulator [Mesorhizobium sp. CA4]
MGKRDLDEPLRDARTLAVQLRDRLADLIRTEGLKPGDRLPTESQLTQRFRISRPALREALKLLEQDGIISVTHGLGRFVTANSAVQVDRPITVFESVTDMSRHYGYNTVNKVLSIAEETPDPFIQQQLRLADGERVIRLERLRLHNDLPLIYSLDYVPRSFLPGRLFDIEWSGSLLALLEKHRHQPRMSAASVAAVTLPDEIVQRNDLRDFGPALLITETCFDGTGTPVVHAAVYHRGSHFAFSFARK